MDFPAQKAAFLRKLRLRPEDCPPPRDRIRFQFVDLKVGGSQVVMPMRPKSRTYLSESMGDKEYDTDTVAALFGTAEDGHSVCVMVKDFEPYFDLSMDDGWVDEHFDKIARYFSRTKDPLRYKTYRGPRVFGYVPDADGQPKVSTWLRLHFPTMGRFEASCEASTATGKGFSERFSRRSIPRRTCTFGSSSSWRATRTPSSRCFSRTRTWSLPDG